MEIISNLEMTRREQAAFAGGIQPMDLMERAGELMAKHIIGTILKVGRFSVFVGKGNNGGDGLVVARHLAKNSHRRVDVILAEPDDKLSPLAQQNLKRLRDEVPTVDIHNYQPDLWPKLEPELIIDALLGLNATGPLREPYASIIRGVNAWRESRFCRTVALDIPSGLAAYEMGLPPESRDAAIVADFTLSVGFPKAVLCREALAGWVGRLEVIPWSKEVAEATSGFAQTLDPWMLAPLLPRRSAASFKNKFGRVVIIAGSPGFTGAPVLTAHGAQKAGAGLISVITTPETYPIVATKLPPEVMVSPWDAELPDVVQKADVIVLGPGLGESEATRDKLWQILQLDRPVVLDADGLNVLAQNLDFLAQKKARVLLTPHPGEMARLIGRKFSADEREAVAREFVEKCQVTLLLKGTRTLITGPGQPFYYNTTGNPSLSTGGSGDTLSGILGALLGQGLSLLDAARFGAWWQGHAADLTLQKIGGEEGITPTQIADLLPSALVSLRSQTVVRGTLL